MLSFLKSKKLWVVAGIFCFSANILPIHALADDSTVESITKQEANLSKEGVNLTQEMNQALTNMNEKYQSIEKLKKNIDKSEKDILATEEKVTETEANLDKRVTVVKEQLKAVQVKGSVTSQALQTLTSSGNISDLAQKIYGISVLHGAESEKITTLTEEKDKLNVMKQELADSKEKLTSKQEKLETEVSDLDGQVVSLKEKLAENTDVLNALSDQRKQLTEITSSSSSSSSSESTASSESASSESSTTSSSSTESSVAPSVESSTTETSSAPVEQPASSSTESTGGDTQATSGFSNTLTVSSTAYSYAQAGLSYFTATGIDLRVNPNVIAVDPSVIPLNTMVEVEGYGYVIAGDTGGAIKGNKIDVHFPTVAQCTQWGRKNVTVRF